jgi:hypothetical protein
MTTAIPDTDLPDRPLVDPTTLTRDDRMVTPREAAEIIGVDETTLREWRYTHVGPPYVQFNHRPPEPGRRPAGKIRYPVRMLLAWSQDRLTVPEPEVTTPDG